MSRFPSQSESEYNPDPNIVLPHEDDGGYSDSDQSVWAPPSVYSRSSYGDPASTDSKSARTDGGLGYPYRHGDTARRVAGTRRALSDALADYWADGVPPVPSVLRDGLLMLNAGHELDDSYRALLLRAALYHRRGILTALAHQVDGERTAVIVHDALVDSAAPLPSTQLARVVREDVTFETWQAYLRGELLTTARHYDPAQRKLAEAALAVLDGNPLHGMEAANAQAVAELELEERSNRRSRIPLLIALLLALVVAAVLLFVWQVERSRTSGMIAISGGVFSLSDGKGSNHVATLAPYVMDPMEITNGQYRQCVQRGVCPSPDSNSSATHAEYFSDPVFADYPVVHVDWAAAADYCAWTRRRLPTADEWHVAAGYAPATQRIFAYPWGNLYASGLANDSNSAAGDLLTGGQYRPAGDSTMGLSDMAGNAAEWTATPDPQSPATYWVKGGSFRDGPEQIKTAGGFLLPATESNDWIGFRCAATPLDTAWLRWFDR